MTLKFKWETEFKETGIGEIPRDWEVRKIGIVAKVNEELINKNYNYKIIEYIDINSVESGLILEKKVIPLEIAPTRARRVVRNNDILLSTVRPNLRHYAFVKYSKPNTIASTGFAVIRAKNIEPRYLYYYITTDFVTEYLTQIAETHTSAYPSFTPDVVENLKTPYPSTSEQSRIATVLSWFDDLIENKKRQNEILEKVAMAIFKSWFVDFEPFKDEEFVYSEELGKEIPKGWEVEELGEFVSTQYGFTASGEETGKIKLLRIKDINKAFVIDWDSVPFCNIINDIFPKYQLKNMDIVISRIGDIGKVAIIENPSLSVFASYLIRLKIKNHKLTPYYLYYWLKAPDYQEYIQGAAEGSTRPNTNAEVIKAGPILIPPPSLIEKFEEVVFPIRSKIILNQKQIMVLRKIRDALLPRLVFGRLRVEEI